MESSSPNLTFDENITNANNFIADTPLTTIENLTFNANKVKFTNCKSLRNIRNITFSENIDDISSFFEGCISRVLNSNYTPKDTEEITELSTQDDTVFELYQDVTNIHFNNNIKPKTVRVGYLDIE